MKESKVLKGQRQESQEMDLESPLVKEQVVRSPLSGGVLKNNIVEAMSEAEAIVEKAYQDAEVIRGKARALYERIETIRDQAIEEGRQEGRKESEKQLSDFLSRFVAENEKLHEHLEKGVLRLVNEISYKVLGRELNSPDAVVDLIRQALQTVMGNQIVLLVHPSDMETVRFHQSRLIAAIEVSRSLTIRPDEKVARGGCILETELGTLDAQLATQLKTLSHILLPGDAQEDHEAGF